MTKAKRLEIEAGVLKVLPSADMDGAYPYLLAERFNVKPADMLTVLKGLIKDGRVREGAVTRYGTQMVRTGRGKTTCAARQGECCPQCSLTMGKGFRCAKWQGKILTVKKGWAVRLPECMGV